MLKPENLIRFPVTFKNELGLRIVASSYARAKQAIRELDGKIDDNRDPVLDDTSHPDAESHDIGEPRIKQRHDIFLAYDANGMLIRNDILDMAFRLSWHGQYRFDILRKKCSATNRAQIFRTPANPCPSHTGAKPAQDYAENTGTRKKDHFHA